MYFADKVESGELLEWSPESERGVTRLTITSDYPGRSNEAKDPSPLSYAAALRSPEYMITPAAHDNWTRALDAHSAGHIATALIAIELVVTTDSQPVTRIVRAEHLAGAHRFAEAEAALLAESRTEDRGLQRILATSWARHRYQQRRYVEAADWYRKSAELQPECTAGWIQMGGAYAKAGRLADAEACHRKAATCEGDPDEAYLNLGYVLRAQRRFEEARDAFAAAVAITPDYPEAIEGLDDATRALRAPSARIDRRAQWKRVMAAWSAGDLACTVAELDRYDELSPDSDPANYLRAQVDMADRRFADAALTLLRCEEPERARHRAGRYETWGELFDLQGRFDEAITWYEKAARMEPQSCAPRTLIGTSHMMAGRLADAEESYRRALSHERDRDFALQELGHLLRMMLRLEEARDVLEACLTLGASQRAESSLADVRSALALRDDSGSPVATP